MTREAERVESGIDARPLGIPYVLDGDCIVIVARVVSELVKKGLGLIGLPININLTGADELSFYLKKITCQCPGGITNTELELVWGCPRSFGLPGLGKRCDPVRGCAEGVCARDPNGNWMCVCSKDGQECNSDSECCEGFTCRYLRSPLYPPGYCEPQSPSSPPPQNGYPPDA